VSAASRSGGRGKAAGVSDSPFEEAGAGEAGAEGAAADEALVVALDGYEGPIDLLLSMAREQKVDLTRISILQLADQYLGFIEKVRQLRIELAADYLVMAAWLAYLKSRLLLPDPPESDEEPTPEELAAALAFQLRRLEAMREAAERMMRLPQLGRDLFVRGAPEGLSVTKRPVFETTLYELLKAYAEHRRRQEASTLTIAPTQLYSLEEALMRLNELLGRLPDWAMLAHFIPAGFSDPLRSRSAVASTFLATLELTKAGRLELRQDRPFAPIWLRRLSSQSSEG